MRKIPQNNILKDKGQFTKFQILFEVMKNQPYVKQKDISDALGITIQAISKYFKVLTKEGMLEAGSERADYRLTPKGVARLHDDVKSLEDYVRMVRNEVKVEHAWIALATQPVKCGEQVGLMTKEGIFFTVPLGDPQIEAIGIATTDAQAGEDIGLKDLKGKVKLKQGKILIIRLPSIRRGGSRATDLNKIKTLCQEFKPDRIGVMGAVGRAVLNKLNLEPDLEFGISNAAAFAASRGLNVMVLVVGRMVNRMIQEIDTLNLRLPGEIIYEVKDAALNELKL